MIALIINSFYTLLISLVIVGHSDLSYQSSADLFTFFSKSYLLTQVPSSSPGTPTTTFTPGASSTITPTTTLIPLPQITLIFPARTDTPTPSITPTRSEKLETPMPTAGERDDNIPPRLRIIAIVLILLWILLAGYLVVYIRQLF